MPTIFPQWVNSSNNQMFRRIQDQYIYAQWNTAGPWSSTTSTTTGGYIWTNWNDSWTASTVTNTVIWDAWWDNVQRTAVPVYSMDDLRGVRREAPAFVRSEADWATIRAEQEAQRRIRDEAQKEAREEARRLMRIVLAPEQVAQYERDGYFEVVGSEGGLFRLYHGTSGNVKQVVDGREVNVLCVHPRLTDHRYDEGEGLGYLPTEDSLIAQAFALMHDELGTVQIANVHRGPRHLRAVA